MLPRKLVEEFLNRFGATGLHVLVALADGFNGLLIILAFPLEIVRQRVVKRVSCGLASPARKLLQLSQSSGFTGSVSITS